MNHSMRTFVNEESLKFEIGVETEIDIEKGLKLCHEYYGIPGVDQLR